MELALLSKFASRTLKITKDHQKENFRHQENLPENPPHKVRSSFPSNQTIQKSAPPRELIIKNQNQTLRNLHMHPCHMPCLPSRPTQAALAGEGV